MAQSHAEDMDQFVERFMDRLVERASQVLPTQHEDVDDTMLGKPGSVVSPQRASLIPAAAVGRARRPTMANQVVRTSLPLNNDPPIWNPFVKKQGKLDAKGSNYKGWPAAYKELVKAGIQAVTGPEVLDLVKNEGAVLVDVRRESLFREETVEGAVNIPLFRVVQGSSMFDHLKRFTTKSLGVEATERNPDFAAMALKELPRDRPIIVMCDRGGLLDDDVPDTTDAYIEGFVDRHPNRYTASLKALHELQQAGFSKMYYLKGGLSTWYSDLPMVTHMDP
eukprot:gnl/MRDRNA2_/MRDRNA2_112529_c0_seq1.p1 gnl/MRDRNA2_/MRDRNA2_112529_c0~~gnl/MRDRNA2_/MRDRNA2_112529_c0_seq1.p1  ORF type:complete len:318 (+),score=68.48 gnl/MRDRNA2_/MRDRNA2_112529_c0_seq1:119-955(+)